MPRRVDKMQQVIQPVFVVVVNHGARLRFYCCASLALDVEFVEDLSGCYFCLAVIQNSTWIGKIMVCISCGCLTCHACYFPAPTLVVRAEYIA